jgi:hypothetical protein
MIWLILYGLLVAVFITAALIEKDSIEYQKKDNDRVFSKLTIDE